MARYLIGSKFRIIVQEGDFPSTITVVLPDALNLALYSEIVFGVYNSTTGAEIFTRKLSTGDIYTDNQDINITLEADNTLGKEGKYSWELEISKGGEAITVAEGTFKIKNQLIAN